MKAMVQDKYGSAEVLEGRDIAKPEIGADEVLVRVQAASVHVGDWILMTGSPFVMRFATGLSKPKNLVPGTDVAGIVEAVGPQVKELRPGDEVFGWCAGAFAEYASAPEGQFIKKPVGLTFDEAAAVGVSASTALQLLRDNGKVRPGQKVLVNGASGGVGSFAVQIAKALGAEVTAVCSTRHVDATRSLGADEVVDYTRDDFTRTDRRYDLVVDVAGSSGWRNLRRVVAPGGRVVVIGGPSGRLLGPLPHIASYKLGGIGSRVPMSFFVAKVDRESLGALRELIEAGTVKPVIDRRFELEELPEALRLMGEGHVGGKLVVSVP